MPSQPRVALISREYPPGYGGGIGTYVENAARTLAGLGAAVHVITEPHVSRPTLEADGLLTVSDPVLGLRILFLEGGPAECEDSCDIDDNGALQIGDMLRLLNALFREGPLPASPYPECGDDPTLDELDCPESFPWCE